MKTLIKIPEYFLEIHIEGKRIQCVNQTTQEVIYKAGKESENDILNL